MAYKNKEDQAKCARKHYLANKDKFRKRATAFNKVAKARNRKFVAEYLETHHCVDCGNSNPIVLEFDHVKGKKLANVADLVRKPAALERVIVEISKCEVRCANCHRVVTYNRRNKNSGVE